MLRKESVSTSKPLRRPGGGRPTIGLIINDLVGMYQLPLWTGTVAKSRQADVNLICVAAGGLRAPYSFDAQRNILYDVITPENVDGLVVVTGTLSNFVGNEEFCRYCERYKPLPIVSVAGDLGEAPKVLVDNDIGMREAVAHLIEFHGRRRIGFIRGPAANAEAQRRYQVYQEVMAAHNLPVDPALSIFGDFRPDVGYEAMRKLLSECKEPPEAMLAANDDMALGALTAAQERGVHVPEKMALIGFDDIQSDQFVLPPLTSVNQPLHEQGQRAVELLLAMMRGESVPRETILPSRLVTRQSCGCLSAMIQRARLGELPAMAKPFEADFVLLRRRMLPEMKEVVGETPGIDDGWEDRLLRIFADELRGAEAAGKFILTLEDVLHQAVVAGLEVSCWQNAISVLRRHALPGLVYSAAKYSRAENMWQEARVLIGEMAERQQAYKRLLADQRAHALSQISQALLTTFDVGQLMDVVAEQLPRVNIRGCYLVLYESRANLTEWGELVLAYSENGRVALEDGGQRFPVRQLLPPGILPRDRQYTLVLQPLFFREEQLGYVMFEMGPEEGLMYETLREQMSSSLKGALVLAEQRNARSELEESRQRLESALAEIVAVQRRYLQQVWEDYARAAQSIRGYAQVGREERPADDAWLPVMAEAVEKVTTVSRSNGQNTLAVPIRLYGEVIGVLGFARDGDLQWTPDEMDAVEDVVEQMALALENQRLFVETKNRAAELATVAEVSTAASTILDADSLLQTVVDLTKESFGLYHAHIYLVEGDQLVLKAGAGEVGRRMVADGRIIPIGKEQSLVARAARTRQGVIANDVRQEPGFLPNPYLPDTRSEMAVPMIVGEKLLGVFDVQSDLVNRFTAEDLRIHTTLSSQVAVALQNAYMYAEQAATVARLRELDHLKSSFLANMSHELRTPLNSILGFTEVLREGIDGELTEQMENDLKIIYQNGRHLLELINEVLDMSKIAAGRMQISPERFDLQEVLEEVINMSSALAAEKSLELRLETLPTERMDIEADRMRIRQVITNLVGNSIKFTESGHVSVHAEKANGQVRITVRDTGIGIPPEQIEAIFQEFHQVDSSTTRKVGGTGLGLPISRHLIEMHGGKLWAESKGIPGEGSTFYIVMPLEFQGGST